MIVRTTAFLAALCLSAGLVRPDPTRPIPDQPTEFLINHCLNCHNEVELKGDLDLDHETIRWGEEESREIWETVHSMLDQGLMPPAKEPQPSPEELQAILPWLDESLLTYTPIGGTLPRRLNQAEYQTTIRQLFSLSDFQVPDGFPRDAEHHGFNNLGEGLVISPPLMEAYQNVAGRIADLIFPPPKVTPPSTSRTAGPSDMVLSFSAATVKDGRLRMASRSETIMRSCTWPSRIEIMDSGTYRITVSASTFRPITPEPMILELRARELTASDRSDVNTFRLLKTLEISTSSPESFTFEADLYDGQTLLFRWANAQMDHEFNALADQMTAWFEREPRFLAAWQKAVFPEGDLTKTNTTRLRGRNGWDIVTRNLADPALDLSQAYVESPVSQALLKQIRSLQGTFNIADALCHYYFENGPALEFHGVTVEGPLQLVDDPDDRRSQKIRQRLLGDRLPGQTDETIARQVLQRFLPQAFRRPVDDQTIEIYLAIARQHWAQGHDFESGIHLLIRNVLISPRFLYRGIGGERWDDYDLATRLAYFLTQSPPDSRLTRLAMTGQLSEPAILRAEARRLLPQRPDDAMIRSFTGQWLDTNLLAGLMPDPAFDFSEPEMNLAKTEVEWFFAEMLTKNLPMADFIDPDFAVTSRAFAQKNYQYDSTGAPASAAYYDDELKIERLPFPRGGRFGGILAQSAVMMATANGVDTQPVLRGAWVLENILGTPSPEPPQDVPALTPDTRGATTPRELLAAHTSEASCATCHQRIDPLGFVLENFDPVGNWREEWPKSGIPIDASGTLPDGTPVKNITDLKAWLVEHIDLFSQCLAEKLMTYATGRVPNYAERKEIEHIVRANHAQGNGFQDLVLALVTSTTFGTK